MFYTNLSKDLKIYISHHGLLISNKKYVKIINLFQVVFYSDLFFQLLQQS